MILGILVAIYCFLALVYKAVQIDSLYSEFNKLKHEGKVQQTWKEFLEINTGIKQ